MKCLNWEDEVFLLFKKYFSEPLQIFLNRSSKTGFLDF